MAKHKKKRKRLHLRRGFILLIALLLLFGGFPLSRRDPATAVSARSECQR